MRSIITLATLRLTWRRSRWMNAVTAFRQGLMSISADILITDHRGTVQLTLINPSRTPFKTFLVPFDLTAMPAETKTFIRQKISRGAPSRTCYAIHLRFSSPKVQCAFSHRRALITAPTGRSVLPRKADQGSLSDAAPGRGRGAEGESRPPARPSVLSLLAPDVNAALG